LPSGKAYSCPGETSVCSKVCYAGKLEKIYKGVRDTLLHNWELLKDADHDTMENLLQDMINDFKSDCDKRNADNLSLYFSTDSENKEVAIELSQKGIRLAYLADTFAIGQTDMKAMIGKPGAKCPENKKAIPLIEKEGSACVKCSLCVYNKADIVFSAKKK